MKLLISKIYGIIIYNKQLEYDKITVYNILKYLYKIDFFTLKKKELTIHLFLIH